MRVCSNCKKEKEIKDFIKPDHKTCEKCIIRLRKWERKNKVFYTAHMSA